MLGSSVRCCACSTALSLDLVDRIRRCRDVIGESVDMLRNLFAVAAISLAASGCGVETAATIGAAKAQRAKEGKQTLQDVRSKLAAVGQSRIKNL